VIGAVTGGAAPLVSEVFKRTVARLSKSDVAVIARQLGISRTAARQVRRALDVGGPDEAIAALQRAGDRAMLADAGPAAQTLLDAASTSGPRAAQMVVGAVRDRTEAETPRLVRMFDNVLGAAKGERELIDAARRQTAAPRSAAYDAAYATPIDYSAGQGRSLEALQGGVPERAVMEANALMRVRGEQSRQIIARVGNDGGVTFDEMPDVRQWHYIAQALDGMAETSDFQGALGGQTPMGSGLQGLSRNIRDRLKAISPAFAEASRQAADTIQQQKNIELGFDLLQDRVRREDVARQIAGQQGGNVSGVREGLRSFLDEQMGRVRRTITNPDAETESAIQALRLFSSPNNQTKLRMVLGQDEAQRLIDEVDSMTTSFELRAAVARNSQTAIRQATQEGINEAAASGPLRTLMAGEPINAAKLLTQAITGEGPEAVALRRQGLYEEIAETLTQTRGARADRALRMIRTAMNGQSQLSERQAEFIAEAVATGALSVDRSVTQSQASPPPR
jgi:PHD/YefM family antitoxin component YafN of YafNO toxin-antitoxin module